MAGWGREGYATRRRRFRSTACPGACIGFAHDVEAGEFRFFVGLGFVGIEKVVDDLKSDAEIVGIGGQLVQCGRRGGCHVGTEANRSGEEIRGLVLEDIIHDVARRGAGIGDILDLSGDHALRTGCMGQFRDEQGDGSGCGFGGTREDLKGQRLERVADENREAFTVFGVDRGLAAAQEIVVHTGKIVVDQRVGMEQFNCAGGIARVCGIPPGCLAGGKAEDGAQAFSSAEHSVAHGLGQGGRARAELRQAGEEVRLNVRFAFREITGEWR